MEGNLWWQGSIRTHWEAIMGPNVLMWFRELPSCLQRDHPDARLVVPVGRSPVDGLSFPLNPRFDSEGRWRPRREWPIELQ